MKKRRAALITGGAGFIGSNLARALLDRRYRVWVIDNLITGRRENIAPFLGRKDFTFLKFDIENPAFFQKLGREKIDEIYHLACPTGVPNIKWLGEEMVRACSHGTLNVLEFARKKKSRLLFASTAEIYGQPEVSPQNETYHGNVDPIGPRSPYEEGKRFSEALVALYVRKYGLNARVVRIFNIYGPGMSLRDWRVIPQFIKAGLEGGRLPVYGDGMQTRTHLFVDDLVRGLLVIMARGKRGEAYNIGGTKQIPVKRLASTIVRLTGGRARIAHLPHFIEDHRRREPSVKKVGRLGWKQRIPLEEGLRRMIGTYRKQ